jgi:hypothetical protein
MTSATPPRIGRVMSLQSGTEHGDDDRPGPPDMYDALRDLFLGGPEETPTRPASEPAVAEAPRRTDAAGHPRIEALILGHLPVQQSPWVMQYARDCAAQRGGPVGLLRIREGEATLDLVGSPAESADAPAKGTLEEALVEISHRAKSLIIRADATAEPVLAASSGVDAVTMLTGADQAAVLGAYRAIKGLVATAQDQLPGLRLAIMGSTPDKALPAAEKIQKAVESNLSIPVTVTACLARIGAGRSTLIFRGLVSEDIESILDRARGLFAQPTQTKPASVIPAPPKVAEAGAVEPLPVVPVFSRLGHAAAPAPAPILASTAAASSLLTHVPGLRPAPIKCPYHPAVEVALDEGGALHLLRHASSPAEVAAAVGSLFSASSWARDHSRLIGLAMQQSKALEAPTLHLFTPAIKDCRGLAEAGIRLHLLARVEVEGKSGWFCTEVG